MDACRTHTVKIECTDNGHEDLLCTDGTVTMMATGESDVKGNGRKDHPPTATGIGWIIVPIFLDQGLIQLGGPWN